MINYSLPIDQIGWYNITCFREGDKIYTKMEEKAGKDWFNVTYVYDPETRDNILVSIIPMEKNDD